MSRGAKGARQDKASRQAATQSDEQDESLFDRRTLLKGVGVGALGVCGVGGVLYALRSAHAKSVESIGMQADAIVAKYATCVSKHTVPGAKKHVVFLKQFHGGGSGLEKSAENTDWLAFFLRHHNGLVSAYNDLSQRYPDQLHGIIEGLAGPSKLWAPEGRGTFEAIALRENRLKTPQGEAEAVKLIQELVRIKPDSGVLNVHGACMRITSQAFGNGAIESIWGADIPGGKSLGPAVNALLLEVRTVGQKGPLSDEQVDSFLSRFRQLGTEDSLTRHQYILKQIRELPEGSLVVVVLGCDHFSCGAVASRFPEEICLESMSKRENHFNFSVWDEKYLPPTITGGLPSGFLMFDIMNATPEQIRTIADPQITLKGLRH